MYETFVIYVKKKKKNAIFLFFCVGLGWGIENEYGSGGIFVEQEIHIGYVNSLPLSCFNLTCLTFPTGYEAPKLRYVLILISLFLV